MARRGHPGLADEEAGKIPRTHRGARRQAFHAELLVEMLARPAQHRGEPSVGAIQFQQSRELRLAARPAVIDDQLLRGLARDPLAEIVGDHRQREVNAGGDARRGPNIAIPDIDAVGFEPHPRKAPGEIGTAVPMGGGAPAIEQSQRGNQISAGTDAGDPLGAFCRR